MSEIRTKLLRFQTLYEIRTIQQPNDNGNVRNPKVWILDVHCTFFLDRNEQKTECNSYEDEEASISKYVIANNESSSLRDKISKPEVTKNTCLECGKSFSRKSILNQHMLKHRVNLYSLLTTKCQSSVCMHLQMSYT